MNPIRPVSTLRRWLESDLLVLVGCLCAIPIGLLLAAR